MLVVAALVALPLQSFADNFPSNWRNWRAWQVTFTNNYGYDLTLTRVRDKCMTNRGDEKFRLNKGESITKNYKANTSLHDLCNYAKSMYVKYSITGPVSSDYYGAIEIGLYTQKYTNHKGEHKKYLAGEGKFDKEHATMKGLPVAITCVNPHNTTWEVDCFEKPASDIGGPHGGTFPYSVTFGSKQSAYDALNEQPQKEAFVNQ
jgi:hypothetical protein